MLEVELDIFSGAPNPAWILSRRQEQTLLEMLRVDRKQISPEVTGNPRLCLGYRGVIVRRTKTDDGVWDKAMSSKHTRFPDVFRLGLSVEKGESAASWLLKTAHKQGARIADDVMEVASRGIRAAPAVRGPARTNRSSACRRRKCRPIIRSSPARNRTKRGGPAVPTTFRRTHISSMTRRTLRATTVTALPAITCPISVTHGPVSALDVAQFMTCGSVIEGLRADGWVDGCNEQPHHCAGDLAEP